MRHVRRRFAKTWRSHATAKDGSETFGQRVGSELAHEEAEGSYIFCLLCSTYQLSVVYGGPVFAGACGQPLVFVTYCLLCHAIALFVACGRLLGQLEPRVVDLNSFLLDALYAVRSWCGFAMSS